MSWAQREAGPRIESGLPPDADGSDTLEFLALRAPPAPAPEEAAEGAPRTDLESSDPSLAVRARPEARLERWTRPDRVVACGDCGGLLRRLLACRGIDVSTAADVETALPVRGADLRSVYVTSWQVGPERADRLLEALGRYLAPPLPCVVVVDAVDGAATERCLRLGATAVVQKDDFEGLLLELEPLLDMRFGGEPRAELDSPVTIDLGDEGGVDVEAKDLRPGGIAVQGLRFAIGDRLCRLTFVLGARLVHVWGYAVREWAEEGTGYAAFRFVATSPQLKRWLREQIEPMTMYGPFEPDQSMTSDWRRQVRQMVRWIERPVLFCDWREP